MGRSTFGKHFCNHKVKYQEGSSQTLSTLIHLFLYVSQPLSNTTSCLRVEVFIANTGSALHFIFLENFLISQREKKISFPLDSWSPRLSMTLCEIWNNIVQCRDSSWFCFAQWHLSPNYLKALITHLRNCTQQLHFLPESLLLNSFFRSHWLPEIFFLILAVRCLANGRCKDFSLW